MPPGYVIEVVVVAGVVVGAGEVVVSPGQEYPDGLIVKSNFEG